MGKPVRIVEQNLITTRSADSAGSRYSEVVPVRRGEERATVPVPASEAASDRNVLILLSSLGSSADAEIRRIDDAWSSPERERRSLRASRRPTAHPSVRPTRPVPTTPTTND